MPGIWSRCRQIGQPCFVQRCPIREAAIKLVLIVLHDTAELALFPLLESNLKSTGQISVELAPDVTCGRVLTLMRPAARTMISGAEVSLSKADTKLLSDL